MDGRTQGFPAEYCPKYHTASACLPSFYTVSWSQERNTLALGFPYDAKENMIHQITPPSFIAPWSSVDAQVPNVGVFSGQLGHHDWSVTIQPHKQQTVIHCVF